MLRRLEQVSKSQKVRVGALFVVLAIVAAVAVFAGDNYESYGEYQDGYSQYEAFQPTEEDLPETGLETGYAYYSYEEYGDYETYTPYDYTDSGGQQGYIQEPGNQVPGQDNNEIETNEDIGADAYEDYDAYEEFEPSGGYIEFTPFGAGRVVTFITNNPHAAAPTPIPGHETRNTADNGTIGSQAQMPNNPVWGGHYFMQWNTSPDGTGTAFTHASYVPANMNVYAQWAFEVTFMGNGVSLVNSGSPANQTNSTWYGIRRIPLNTTVNANNAHVNPAFQAVWPDNPVVIGFDFVEWNSMPDGSGNTLTGATTINAETAAFAQWTLNTSTVTFNLQGGTLSTGTQTVVNPSPSPAPANITVNHSATRTVITGRSIEYSSHQNRQQFRQNTNVAWSRSAPEVLPPPAGGGTPLALEGWWTQPGGYGGTGTRFAPPGINNTWNNFPWNPPQDLATTNVTGDMTVHAHWVHRIHFQVNGGSAGNRFTGGTPAVGTIVNLQNESSVQSRLFIDVPIGATNTIGTHGRLHRIAHADMNNTYVPLTRLPGNTESQTVLNSNNNPSTGVTVGGTMTRSGHTFGGWWIASNAAGAGLNTTWAPAAVGDPGHPAQMGHIPFTENTPMSAITHAHSTVVAHWIPNPPVQVVFNPNGGEWTAAAIATSHVPTTITGNITRNVTTNANFNTCSISGQSFPTFPTRAGFIFVGWHQVQDTGDGTSILGTAPITTTMTRAPVVTPPATPTTAQQQQRFIPSTAIDETQIVYARWLPVAYIVTFMPNGGSNSPLTRSVPSGWSLSNLHSHAGWNDWANGSPNTGYFGPTTGWTGSAWQQTVRSNWVLLGFNLNAAGTGAVFAHTTAITDNQTVYAAWGANVTFNSRHETVYGTLTNILTSRSLAEGRTVGNSWQVANHPNVATSATNNFPGLNVWDGNPFPTGGDPARTLERPGPPQGTGDPITSRSFVGWNTAQDGSGTWWTADTPMVNGNQHVHAVWRPWVNFRPGIGIPETALSLPFGSLNQYNWSRQFQVGLPLNDTLLGGPANMPPDMTNAWLGHTWLGWFPNPDGTGAMRDFANPVLFARTYYASFLAPVFFHGNGGMITGNSSTEVQIGHQLLQTMPATVTRQGWSFVGLWNTNADNTGAVYDQFSHVWSSINLHASWHAQINFEPGTGGVILPGNTIRHVPEGFTLDENPPGQRMPPNPTHPNPAYEFAGWRITFAENGHPDLTGAPVYFADNMRFNETQAANTANGNIVVTAQWQRMDINITFDFNGGVRNYGGVDYSTRTYSLPRGSLIEDRFQLFDPFPGLPLTAITRANYTFTGEWLNPAILAPAQNIFTNAQVQAQTPQVATTFIAQWAPNPFTVTFQLNSGEHTVGAGAPNPGPIVNSNVLHGSAIGYLNVPATRPVGPGVPDATVLARTGHTLVGWQEVDASDVPFGPTLTTGAVGLLTINGANRTFRAVWTPNRHPVTFVLDGGTVSGNANDVVRLVDHGQTVLHVNTTDSPTVPVPVRTSPPHTFAGWVDSGGNPVSPGSITINGPTTFTATWNPMAVTATFNLDGGNYYGDLGPIVRSLPAASQIGLGNVPIPVRANFTFQHWLANDYPTIGTDTIRTRQQVADVTLVYQQPRLFTAVWAPIQHPVTFILSGGQYGGSQNPVVRTVNQGQSMANSTPVITVPAPTNSPQTFLHWLSNDGTTWSSIIIANLPITGPMTFTAVWDYQMVPVTFDLNGGTYGIIPGPITDNLPAGFPIGLGRVPIPTRENYTFTNWRETDATPAGFTDRNRATVAGLMVEYLVPRTFTAQWTRITHPVTFVLAGGTYNASNSDVVRTVRQGETVLDPQTLATNNVPTPTNTPQLFQHWLRAGHPGPWTPASVAALTITSPETFTAVWDYQRVDITFILHGGMYNGSPADVERSARAGVQIGLGYVPIPSRANYTFVTWREYDYPAAGTDTDRNRAQTAAVVPVYNQPRIFEAQWSRILHPVTFILNGGTYGGGSGNVIRTVRQGESILDPQTTATNTVPAPANLPQVFQHWLRAGHAGPWSPASVSALTIFGPEVFTAVWEYQRVNVTFDLAGGSYNGGAGPITESLRVGIPISLNYVPVPTRANYTFQHWVEYDYPTAGTNTSRNRQEVSQVVPVYQQPRTFVAVWDPIRHPVTFILAGGSYGGSPDNVVRTVNQGQNITHANTTATPSVPLTTRPFQTFMGWRNYDGIVWQPSSVAALTVTESRIFTAVWSADLVSVTFELAGGNVGGNTADIQLDLPIGLDIGLGNVPVPTRDHYTFYRWQEGPVNRDRQQVADIVLDDTARVFTALWNPITHPVTFILSGGQYNGSVNDVVRTVNQNQNITHANTQAVNTVPGPTRANHTLFGWRNYDGVIWQPSSVAALTVMGPRIFTAVWAEDLVPVTFVLDGGLYAGSPSNISLDLPAGLTVGLGNVPVPTRENYSFVTWREFDYPTAGSNADRDRQAVAGVTLVYGQPRVFTAVWAEIWHPVTFVLSGGTYNGSTNAVVRTVHQGHTVLTPSTTAVNTVPTAVNPPQGFEGWRVGDTIQVWDATSVGALTITGPITFTAVWEHSHATVTFDLALGYVGANPGPIVHPLRPVGEALGPAYVPVPARQFHSFEYWLCPAGTSYSSLVVADWIVLQDITFTAVWERVSFPVTFSFHGGSWNAYTNYSISNSLNGSLILPSNVANPDRTHYTLVGWRRDDIGPILQQQDIEGLQVTGPVLFVAVWVRITHPVTFVLDGGSYNNSTANFLWTVDQATEIERVPDPTRLHYTLLGWREYDYPTTGDYTDRSQGQVAEIIVMAPRTFVAQWVRTTHPVVFDLNGGTFNGSGDIITLTVNQNDLIGQYNNVPGPITHPTSSFTNWLREDTNTLHSSANVADIRVAATPGALRFIAQWDLRTYNVTFQLAGGNVNVGGSASTSDVTHTQAFGSLIGGNVPEPARQFHTLQGWTVVSGPGLGMSLTPSQTAGWEVAEDVTFRAVWSQVQVPVTFVLNGGHINDDTNNVVTLVNQGQAIGNVVPSPELDDFDLIGWQQSGEGQVLEATDISAIVAAEPLFFVALWGRVGGAVTHPVTFQLNYGYVGDSSDDVVAHFVAGAEIGSAVPVPVRENFTFLGWREGLGSETISSSYVAAQVVEGPRTFTAMWQRNQHSVTFVLSGGQVGGNTADIGYTIFAGEEVGADRVPAPVRDHSTLTGWQLAGNGPVMSSTNVAEYVVTTSLVFIAIWDTNTHPVTFDLDGGMYSGSTNNVVRVLLDGSIVGTGVIPVPTRDNHTLTGWQLSGEGATLTMSQVAGTQVNAPLLFVAVWAPIQHNVVFELNGGNISGSTTRITNAVNHAAAITPGNVPANPTRAQGTFTGWLEDGTTTIRTAAQVAELVVTGPRIFVAQWDVESVPVTFVLSGGNVGGNTANIEISVIYGSEVGASAVPMPVRVNYTLTGWRLGTAALTPMQAAATTVTAPLTFTAEWEVVRHPVTFMLEGGTYSGSTNNVINQVNQGSAVGTGNVPAPTRGGSVFTGWRELGTQTTITSAAISEIIVTGPRTFIAVWDGVMYDVTFILAGGNVGGATGDITASVQGGDRVGGGNVPEPNRGYFVHSGWTLTSGLVRSVMSGLQVAGTEVTAALTFTAEWTPVSRDVVLGREPYSASIPGHATAVYNYNVDSGTYHDVTFEITPPGNGAIFTAASRAIPPRGYFIVAGPTILANGNMRVTIRRYEVGGTEDPVFRVTFDPTRGTLPAAEPGFREGVLGTLIPTFPTPTPPSGYTFVGWFYGTTLVTPGMVIFQNMTLTAAFAPVPGPNMYTVIYNPGPGLLPSGANSTQQHAYGTPLTSHPTPTRTGYTFAGWRLNNQPIANPLIVRGNITLHAAWTPVTATPSPTPTPPIDDVAPGSYVVTFVPRPGVHTRSYETGIRVGQAGTVINNIPIAPTLQGFVFGGWRLPNGNILVGPLTITGNMTLTAIWTPVAFQPGPTPTPAPPGQRPNPQTGPIQVSFMIFGAVIMVGVAAFGVSKLARKQLVAAGEYRSEKARYNREKRIVEMVTDEKDKK